jgi:drug/metabolite transporter (DMT)-like permease
MVWLLQ